MIPATLMHYFRLRKVYGFRLCKVVFDLIKILCIRNREEFYNLAFQVMIESVIEIVF